MNAYRLCVFTLYAHAYYNRIKFILAINKYGNHLSFNERFTYKIKKKFNS